MPRRWTASRLSGRISFPDFRIPSVSLCGCRQADANCRHFTEGRHAKKTRFHLHSACLSRHPADPDRPAGGSAGGLPGSRPISASSWMAVWTKASGRRPLPPATFTTGCRATTWHRPSRPRSSSHSTARCFMSASPPAIPIPRRFARPSCAATRCWVTRISWRCSSTRWARRNSPSSSA